MVNNFLIKLSLYTDNQTEILTSFFYFKLKIEYSCAFTYFRKEMLTGTPSVNGIKNFVWNLKI
jgi:hypothetical protein